MDIEKVDEYLTVTEAMERVRMTRNTLYAAIRSGALPAVIPRGRDPRHTGRSQGYRIRVVDLDAWFAGGKP